MPNTALKLSPSTLPPQIAPNVKAAMRLEDPDEQHRALHVELQVLSRRAYLTPSEQEGARLLKKLKLRAKDAKALRR